jgi:hypothetical protein
MCGLFNGGVVAPVCYEYSTVGAFFEWWFVMDFFAKNFSAVVVFLVFLLAYLSDFNWILEWWVILRVVLVGLLFVCGFLQEAVIPILIGLIFKLFEYICELRPRFGWIYCY